MEQTDKENYQTQVESYLEENMIFEFFNTLLKELCIKQPESPVDWMIERLQKKAPQRIAILGAPGGIKKEVCQLLAKEMDIKHLSSGAVVVQELENKTDAGKKMEEMGYNEVELVDDHLITKLLCDLIKNEDEYIDMSDKGKSKGWIVDGFPRTFNQAQLMQVSGYLPDKVFILQEDESLCKSKLVRRFVSAQQLPEEEATMSADVK